VKAYYNEHEPYAAQWLRNLIANGHIAPGDVDERDIRDVRPDDLRAYTQCHFFAGIGGWSYAARLAGWPDDRPLWTGSCPCQPFSVAGRREGQTDERHLWPDLFELIRSCRPDVVMGEQVAAAIGKHWLDGVCADLEGVGYAIGAAVVPACAVDAPHRRDRLWFVADADSGQRERANEAVRARRHATDNGGSPLADADDAERRAAQPTRDDDNRQTAGRIKGHGHSPERDARALADTDGRDSFWWSGPLQVGWNCIEGRAETSSQRGRTQWRVKPGLPLLAHGVPGRVGRLRAYGNAIVPQVAAEIISAYLEAREALADKDIFD
jgi:DNA (cytosine-5)-methyltransferase 1